jgi:hypothetical protein
MWGTLPGTLTSLNVPAAGDPFLSARAAGYVHYLFTSCIVIDLNIDIDLRPRYIVDTPVILQNKRGGIT